MRTIKNTSMMRFKNRSKMAFLVIFISIFTTSNLVAQQFKLDNSKSNLSVFGTSSLHDWEEVAEEQSGSIQLVTEGGLTIANLDVSVVAESLKSGKSGMDKNTYKALKTNKYKSITFNLVTSKKVIDLGNSMYQVTVSGKLSVAGTTKTTDLSFKMKVSGNTVTLEGEKTFNMTDYGIEPPTALFGTITTGDEITIKFKTILTK